MMADVKIINRVCPRCGVTYTGYPAVSRADNSDICPECGIREALITIGVTDKGEQDHILQTMYRTEVA